MLQWPQCNSKLLMSPMQRKFEHEHALNSSCALLVHLLVIFLLTGIARCVLISMIDLATLGGSLPNSVCNTSSEGHTVSLEKDRNHFSHLTSDVADLLKDRPGRMESIGVMRGGVNVEPYVVVWIL